jgi:hypothetical protein
MICSRPRQPVPVVEALVGPMIGTQCLAGDRLYVAAQLVGDNDPGLAELSNQACQKALGGVSEPECRPRARASAPRH